MNAIEQYDANNVYYPINVTNCNQIQRLYFGTFDENIYKSKADWGDGTSNNVVSSSSYSTKNYSSNYTGKIKIYSNPKKIKEIILDLGISTLGTVTNPQGNLKNIDLVPNILDFFPNCERLLFNHYCYGSADSSFQGKVIGEWATKCGDKLKSLELRNNDYPQSNPSFDLNLIPNNSVLESLYLGSGFGVYNSFVNVSGSLNNLPSTCKIIYLGNDKLGTSNSVSGIIPNWVEEFSRLGRNTISANVADLSTNMRYLNVQGSNVLTGEIPNWPFITALTILGSNTVSGNLNNINPEIGTILITGSNRISGVFPNFNSVTGIQIDGMNEMSGVIPSYSTLSSITLNGLNTVSGKINLPNVLSLRIGGNNEVSSLNVPKATVIAIGGNNTITGDLTDQINPNIQTLAITGNNTISSISGAFPNCTAFTISGLNNLSGNILSKIPNASSITITGNNTMDTYVSRSFPSTMSILDIQGKAALKTAMVDQILIDLARDVTNWTGTKKVTLRGNCQPPSSASAAARANLTSAPKSITVWTN